MRLLDSELVLCWVFLAPFKYCSAEYTQVRGPGDNVADGSRRMVWLGRPKNAQGPTASHTYTHFASWLLLEFRSSSLGRDAVLSIAWLDADLHGVRGCPKGPTDYQYLSLQTWNSQRLLPHLSHIGHRPSPTPSSALTLQLSFARSPTSKSARSACRSHHTSAPSLISHWASLSLHLLRQRRALIGLTKAYLRVSNSTTGTRRGFVFTQAVGDRSETESESALRLAKRAGDWDGLGSTSGPETRCIATCRPGRG
jgi:hypothetical protein